MPFTVEGKWPTIAIDVDGVIADYSQGWQGEGVVGDPLPGVREFLQRLHDAGWKIIIYTTRGTEQMEKYMAKWDLIYDDINDNTEMRGLNPGKPIASVYLDDRGITFKGDFKEAFEMIQRFKVWYEKENSG